MAINIAWSFLVRTFTHIKRASRFVFSIFILLCIIFVFSIVSLVLHSFFNRNIWANVMLVKWRNLSASSWDVEWDKNPKHWELVGLWANGGIICLESKTSWTLESYVSKPYHWYTYYNMCYIIAIVYFS